MSGLTSGTLETKSDYKKLYLLKGLNYHFSSKKKSLAEERRKRIGTMLWEKGLVWIHLESQSESRSVQSMEFSTPEILEQVAFPFSRGSSQPRDWTQVSRIAGVFFTSWATREAWEYWRGQPIPSLAYLPDPGIKLGSPALQADSLPTELWGNLGYIWKLKGKR